MESGLVLFARSNLVCLSFILISFPRNSEDKVSRDLRKFAELIQRLRLIQREFQSQEYTNNKYTLSRENL